MSTSRLCSLLDETLPDKQIIKDLSERVWQNKKLGGDYVSWGREEYMFIPENVPIDIVTKAFYKEYYENKFGTYKVMAAIGGITRLQHGTLEPGYCIAKLYYSDDCQVMEVLFQQTMRY